MDRPWRSVSASGGPLDARCMEVVTGQAFFLAPGEPTLL
jgi:hypothetical protein